MSLDTIPIESNLDNGFVTQGLIKMALRVPFWPFLKT